MFEPFDDKIETDHHTTENGRTVKIEKLLLSGLDNYFKGRFESAIDIWTRVLFLDKSNTRARAYIERARAALAEGLRESEELLHTGVEAFDRGDTTKARSLLRSAVERGGGRDEARAVLERIDRLEGASGYPAVSQRSNLSSHPERLVYRPTSEPIQNIRVVPLLFFLAFFSGVGYLAVSWSEWRPLLLGLPERPVVSQFTQADSLPFPSISESRLIRAERLIEEERLQEALELFGTIEDGTLLSMEAEALITEIQKRLLAHVSFAETVSELDGTRGQ